MSLTDVACRNAKPESKPRKISKGAGLYLYISPAGTKTWRVDYRHEGKWQTATLGQYPRVTLATARAMRDELKRNLSEGVVPEKGDVLAVHNSFQRVANEWWKPSAGRGPKSTMNASHPGSAATCSHRSGSATLPRLKPLNS
ncbi:MAG: Arm DNA-binding domain-containing protein [Rhodobacterales bacterium]|nr:Arm DNA-binding domain-containing protein [Rhodobacterales bacterium]